MDSARKVAWAVQEREGWTDATLLDVLLDYIDGEHASNALAGYLALRGAPGCPSCGPASDPQCFAECVCACHDERGWE